MQRTPVKTVEDAVNATSQSIPTVKRKLIETSPENLQVQPAKSVDKLVGDMTVMDLMGTIQSAMATLLDDKLKNFPTKTDLEGVTTQMSSMSSQLRELTLENQNLKEQLKQLSAEKEKDRQAIIWLEDQVKNKNIIFKGVETQNSMPEAVKKICDEMIKMPSAVNVRSTRKLYEKNGKMAIIAEFESAEIVEEIFKRTRNLAGTPIILERDLNSIKQQNKKTMLQLRKNILSISRRHRVNVLNDRMRIGAKWFTWNKQHELTCGPLKGEDILKNLYDGEINSVSCSFYDLLKEINQKKN